MIFADVPGAHPGYLHALSDLRYARALLEHDAPAAVGHDQHWALHEIDEAIRVIKDAAIDESTLVKMAGEGVPDGGTHLR